MRKQITQRGSVKDKAMHITEVTQQNLKIKGKIPSWLSGNLIRNGPVMMAIKGHTNPHWFDGLAMLHSFSFDQGRVFYSNKFLRSDAYHTVFNKGSLNYVGFAQDPCRFIFKRYLTWFFPQSQRLNNANINVTKLSDQYVALTEIPLPIKFDPQTLDTLGVFDYEDKLPHAKCWESAHPHHISQMTINYLIDYGKMSHYLIYFLKDHSPKREMIAKIPISCPSYMHSFAVTENYIILTEYPLIIKPLDLITSGKPFIQNFSWKEKLGTHFLVVDRRQGKIVGRYKTRSFFAFHHVNAFEEEEKIILDIVTYDNAEVISKIAHHFRDIPHHRSEESSIKTRLERFTLSRAEDLITTDTIFEGHIEFPRINDRYDSKSYKYSYVINAIEPISSEDIRPIYKIEMVTKKVCLWSEKGCYPGEPIFVSSPNSDDEDEGVILDVVYNLFEKRSFLLILDAKTLQEIGRAEVMHAIPAGLHGQYFEK